MSGDYDHAFVQEDEFPRMDDPRCPILSMISLVSAPTAGGSMDVIYRVGETDLRGAFVQRGCV